VLQAMPYRRGDEADWAASVQGVALMDVPFYLAQAEYAGVVDIQVAAATRKGDEQIVPIAAQADAVVGKALRLVALQRKANADKRIAVFFWNYPPGEKNLSASFLNVPRSLARVSEGLRDAGYAVEPKAEADWIRELAPLLAAYYPGSDLTRRFPWGDESPTADRANLDQLAFRAASPGAYPAGASPHGCVAMIGDVWEWTASAFDGYPGFRPFPYEQYSQVFFGNEYRVLRGGSWATRRRVATSSFRHWDYPIRRQLFCGFRCARDS